MIIGLFLRHIKAYKGINYIPIGEKYNFTSYIGENGVGKSSILEALNSFFNNKKYLVNKNAIDDGIYTKSNNPFILPIFLIEKSKVRSKKKFEKISNFFWNINKSSLPSKTQSSVKDFFDLREGILDKKETHFLILIGETNFEGGHKISFGSFHYEDNFISSFLESEEYDKDNLDLNKEKLDKVLDKVDWKRALQELKDLYSYVYLPVELEIESFTKIETDEMQKIFDKKLKKEIGDILGDIKFDNADGLNKKLENFINEIENILENKYCYETGMQRNNTITKADLIDKIIESYFQKRILNKKDGTIKKKVTELSAGEKRQALIDLVYAFLVKEKERDKMIIIGIDEPENSLHTSLCYEQFEKLRKISTNNQILITTHWYGFLPIISEGYGHFLNTKNIGEINISTYDLYDYRAKVSSDITASRNKIPEDFILKSTYDLVQSIFYSLKIPSSYNWLIVEGISEKIYFEYFFREEIKDKKLRILPMGGKPKVSSLYEYLELPVKESTELKGKIFCLIDTDQEEHKKYINDGNKNLQIRRLSNDNKNEFTKLLPLSHGDNSITDIEQSLHPIIFKNTLEDIKVEDKYKINTIENEMGNCNFIKNFKNLELENYFKEGEGINKIIFSKKYIEVMQKELIQEDFIPDWIEEIKTFFNS